VLLSISLDVEEHRSTPLDRDAAIAAATAAATIAVLGLPGAYDVRASSRPNESDSREPKQDERDFE